MEVIDQNRVPTLIGTGRLTKILVDPATGVKHLSLVTVTFPPGERSEEHAKPSAHEVIYVVQGTLNLICNGRSHIVKQGSVVVVAPGERHIHANDSTEPLVILVILTPPGPEQAFKRRLKLSDISLNE